MKLPPNSQLFDFFYMPSFVISCIAIFLFWHFYSLWSYDGPIVAAMAIITIFVGLLLPFLLAALAEEAVRWHRDFQGYVE